MRKPVAAVQTRAGAMVVVCEDGSVWIAKSLDTNLKWVELPPIPGSKADPTSDEEIPDIQLPDLSREKPGL